LEKGFQFEPPGKFHRWPGSSTRAISQVCKIGDYTYCKIKHAKQEAFSLFARHKSENNCASEAAQQVRYTRIFTSIHIFIIYSANLLSKAQIVTTALCLLKFRQKNSDKRDRC